MVSRDTLVGVSRLITCALFLGIFGSYFFRPVGIAQHSLDIALRAYLHFLMGVMVHEASHGHLGHSARSNRWWGRFAFVTITELPYGIFRRTHLLHHAHTNHPSDDPDAFLKTDKPWQLPFRALAMPYQWVYWLQRQGKLTRADLHEYLAASVVHFGLYLILVGFVGWERMLTGVVPVLILQPLLLWYFFAFRTHEGYSTGSPESRSHNYSGRHLYWFSLGLSLHQVHHLRPKLGWLQMLPEVPAGTWRQRFSLRRELTSLKSRA
jgi:fatty acid desaturase